MSETPVPAFNPARGRGRGRGGSRGRGRGGSSPPANSTSTDSASGATEKSSEGGGWGDEITPAEQQGSNWDESATNVTVGTDKKEAETEATASRARGRGRGGPRGRGRGGPKRSLGVDSPAASATDSKADPEAAEPEGSATATVTYQNDEIGDSKTGGVEAAPKTVQVPKRVAYVRPEDAPREKMTDEALAEKMERIRIQNEKLKARKAEVDADENDYIALTAEEIKQAKFREEKMAEITNARNENAKKKLEKSAGREWDSEKGDSWSKPGEKEKEEGGGGEHWGRGGGRGRARGRGRGTGRGGRGGASGGRRGGDAHVEENQEESESNE